MDWQMGNHRFIGHGSLLPALDVFSHTHPLFHIFLLASHTHARIHTYINTCLLSTRILGLVKMEQTGRSIASEANTGKILK